MEYKRSSLRELLETLSEQDINKSLDCFSEVREEFATGQCMSDKHEIILNHFEQHKEEFPKLLEAIKKLNSQAYDKYVPNLESDKNIENLFRYPSNSTFIDELKKILSKQKNDLFWQCTKRVYHDFLLQTNNQDLVRGSDNLSEYLFSELEDFPEETILLEFVLRLAAYLSIKDIHKYDKFVKQLKNIAKENISCYKNITDNDFYQRLNEFKKEYNTASDKAYLLIKIKDKQAASNSFQISGWFATDEIIENPETDLKSLRNKYLNQPSEDNQVIEKDYKLEEVKEIIRDYQLQINNLINNNDTRKFEKLIVEFFLPFSLLFWDIEQWKVDIDQQNRLASSCEVRIRSLDRLTRLEYGGKNKLWENKWALVKNCSIPHHVFLDSDLNSNSDLVNLLQNKNKLGLKLTSIIELGHEKITSALCNSGTPIAIWFRSTPPEGDCDSQLNDLLQGKLLQLSERVFQARSQPKCHISLIWDDPNRLIPIYQLK